MGDEVVALAEALFDFEGLREDNLQFKRGDVITVLEMNDNGWWRGTDKSGKVGIFPYNYVQVKEDVGESFPIVRALYDYEAINPGDISFSRGENLTVLKELSVDWYYGRMEDGREGNFPKNYVEATGQTDTKMAKEEKKRWSRIKKEKKKEADQAEKKRQSLAKKMAKKKIDEEEKERLKREAQEAALRAKRAEEELAQIKAEAALLKKKQQQSEARTSTRIRKTLVQDQMKIQEMANAAAEKFHGQAPGPPPRLEKEEEDNKSQDDDDIFGQPAPEPEAPQRTLPSQETEEEKAKKEEKPKFKYNQKFAGLGGGARCRACDKTVGFADKVKALGAEWHTGCFTCSTCSVVLRQGEWRENNNNPYCHKCHAKGFGIKGFGFGGSVVPVSAGDGPAKGEVDDRPLFQSLAGDKKD